MYIVCLYMTRACIDYMLFVQIFDTIISVTPSKKTHFVISLFQVGYCSCQLILSVVLFCFKKIEQIGT